MKRLCVAWCTCHLALFLEGLLDGLYLLTDSRQHPLLQTIELIKASPRPNLAQTYKDPAHCLQRVQYYCTTVRDTQVNC